MGGGSSSKHGKTKLQRMGYNINEVRRPAGGAGGQRLGKTVPGEVRGCGDLSATGSLSHGMHLIGQVTRYHVGSYIQTTVRHSRAGRQPPTHCTPSRAVALAPLQVVQRVDVPMLQQLQPLAGAKLANLLSEAADDNISWTRRVRVGGHCRLRLPHWGAASTLSYTRV